MLHYLKLLQTQRELLDIPRGLERFQEYLKKMLKDGEMVVPISGFNPMSKEHVAQTLDVLLEMDAESIGEGIARECFKRLDFGKTEWNMGLVLSDDLMGGWTNRPSIEVERWTNPKKVAWRSFLPLTLWVTDAIDKEALENRLMRQIFEAHSVLMKPPPRDLEGVLRLRRDSMVFSQGGKALPQTPNGKTLLERFRPYFGSTQTGILIACLFGDKEAARLGHPELGFAFGDSDLAVSWL